MGGPEGRSKRACEPAGRSGSGGPEPEAYLKRSDREKPALAGGEISRAAMVSQGRDRPRSCARGAENGAGRAGGNDDNAAGSSVAMDRWRVALTHHRAIGSIVQGTHCDAADFAAGAANDDTVGVESGAKGDGGQRHVDYRHPPAGELRRAPAGRGRVGRPCACRLCDRWREIPTGERLGARIAGIDAPETQAGGGSDGRRSRG